MKTRKKLPASAKKQGWLISVQPNRNPINYEILPTTVIRNQKIKPRYFKGILANFDLMYLYKNILNLEKTSSKEIQNSLFDLMPCEDYFIDGDPTTPDLSLLNSLDRIYSSGDSFCGSSLTRLWVCITVASQQDEPWSIPLTSCCVCMCASALYSSHSAKAPNPL